MADGSYLQKNASSQLLQALMEGDIYLVDIHIYGCGYSRQIRWEDLEEDPQRLEEIKLSRATCPTIEMLEPLGKARNKLSYLREKALRYALISPPYKFVKEENLAQFQEAFDELLMEADLSLENILSSWHEEQASFKKRLLQALPNASDEVVDRYLSKIPSQQQIKDTFAVVLTGPVSISNMRQHIQLAAETLDSQQNLAKQQLQQKYVQGVEKSLESAVQGVQAELQKIVLEQLDRIQSSKTKNLSSRTITAMQESLERAKVLVSFDKGMEEIVHQLSVVSASAINQSGLLEERLQSFISQVDGFVDLSKSSVSASASSFMI